jgi:sterol desaturase/sphingolipid hydroxylase (fatty acid hydroxylase superfamily)
MVVGVLLLTGFICGFIFGTFGEYWIHRAMHVNVFLAKRHWEHHRDGRGQGLLKEFRDYASGTIAVALLCLPLDYYWGSGGIFALGIVCGVLSHAIFAAWCHQAQHEDPRLLAWLKKTPVHFVHHELGQSRYNFGISVDWWDRVFQTYKPEPNWRALLDIDAPLRSWWFVNWLDHRAVKGGRSM